jgi:hypothetical protein
MKRLQPFTSSSFGSMEFVPFGAVHALKGTNLDEASAGEVHAPLTASAYHHYG